jgi:hypothetical protein
MPDAAVCGDGVTFEVLVDDGGVFTSSPQASSAAVK